MTCVLYDTDGLPYVTKTPDEVLDYKVDFAPSTNGRDGATSDWLESGETLSSATVTVPDGITKDSDSLADTNTSVLVWLSGGSAGFEYRVSVEAVTSSSRTVERVFRVKMVPYR